VSFVSVAEELSSTSAKCFSAVNVDSNYFNSRFKYSVVFLKYRV